MNLQRRRRELAVLERRLRQSPNENPEIARARREHKENEAMYSKHRREQVALDVWMLERGGRPEAAARLRRVADGPELLRARDAVVDDLRAAWDALSLTQRDQLLLKRRLLHAEWIAVHLRWMRRDARRQSLSQDAEEAYVTREWNRLAKLGILPALPRTSPPDATTASQPASPPAEAPTTR